MFEFSLTTGYTNGKNLEIIYNFLEQYTPIVQITPSFLILFNLKKEKLFLTNLEIGSSEIHIIDYSLICVEKGYIVSSWLKKI